MDIRPPTVRVKLAPTAGYCIKSTTLQDAICRISPKPPDLENGGDAASNKGGESINSLITSVVGQASGTLKVSKGTKVFVNIAWDSNVPPPPEGNEEMIQRAMRGEQALDDESRREGGAWFVPVIVSEPRQDLDKGMYSAFPYTFRPFCDWTLRPLRIP